MGLFNFSIFKRDSATGTIVADGMSDGGYTVPAPLMPNAVYGEDAMVVATAYRCVQLLADSVAQLPMKYERLNRAAGVYRPDERDGLAYLMQVQPAWGWTAFEFWGQIVREILMAGNAYVLPIFNPSEGVYTRLLFCPRDSVTHDCDRDIYTVKLSGADAKYNRDYYASEILHFKGYPSSVNPKDGVSVLMHAAQTVGTSNTGNTETAKRLRNGNNIRGLVSSDGSKMAGLAKGAPNELRKVAADLDARVNGGGQNFVAAPAPTTVTQWTTPPSDLQFLLETRKFGVREICRFFGVHPSFVFDDTSNNYKSAEMAKTAFLSDTLNPLLRKIESELEAKLIPRSLWGKRRFRFDRAALTTADTETRMKYLEKKLATGLSTVNELRAEENMEPVNGGDAVLVSANLKPVTTLM